MSDTPRKYAQCTREEWFERWEAWTANDYIAEEEQMAMRDCFAHIEELERENAALRAELEGVRKDAERYRWLRESVKDLKRMVAAQAMFWNNHPSRTKFEAAIDAAIAQGKNQQSNAAQPKE